MKTTNLQTFIILLSHVILIHQGKILFFHVFSLFPIYQPSVAKEKLQKGFYMVLLFNI